MYVFVKNNILANFRTDFLWRKKKREAREIITVREQLFDTIALNDDISIKSSSNLQSNARFGKLIQFCVQKCPWKLNLIKNEGSYEGFKTKIKGFFPLYQHWLKLRTDIQFFPPLCFAWYWLQIWPILKNNTSFEILRT